jgi:putative ABC transport system ATP-binding protein
MLPEREWLAVQGPTGHGKSTLLQILGGLDRPSSGIVEFDGRDLAQLREAEMTQVRAQSIGFVFQTFNLVPTLSALENVEAALVPLRIGSAARRQRATTALEAVGLGDRLRHVPSELWREHGLTMVLVTHDSVIARRAQRIGVMKMAALDSSSLARGKPRGPRRREPVVPLATRRRLIPAALPAAAPRPGPRVPAARQPARDDRTTGRCSPRPGSGKRPRAGSRSRRPPAAGRS